MIGGWFHGGCVRWWATFPEHQEGDLFRSGRPRQTVAAERRREAPHLLDDLPRLVPGCGRNTKRRPSPGSATPATARRLQQDCRRAERSPLTPDLVALARLPAAAAVKDLKSSAPSSSSGPESRSSPFSWGRLPGRTLLPGTAPRTTRRPRGTRPTADCLSRRSPCDAEPPRRGADSRDGSPPAGRSPPW